MSFPNATWVDSSQIYTFTGTGTATDITNVNTFTNAGKTKTSLSLHDNNYTVMTWLKFEPETDITTAARDWGLIGNNRLHLALRTTAGNPNAHYYFGLFAGGSDVAGSAVTKNQWVHVAFTFDGTTQNIYVNGSLDATNTPPGGHDTGTETIYFGNWLDTTTDRLFQGSLANTFIFNTALSQSDIINYKSLGIQLIPSSVNTLQPPGTVNHSDFNTRRQFPNNNGIVNNYMGMPSKDGSASNKTDFVLGRRFFIQYRQPASKQELDKLFKDKIVGPQTSDTIVKTSRREAGKPIPQNSVDLYIQRRRMLATGKGSTTTQEQNGPVQLKGGEDKNYKNQRLAHVKAGGSIAPPRTNGKVPGPTQPSIFARRTRR